MANKTLNAEQVRQTMPQRINNYYTTGTKNLENLSPDTWTLDRAFFNRPGNEDIQLALKHDYQSNVLLYPQWQAYFRQHQPPMLVVWGKNDQLLVEEGLCYKPFAEP
ncbi:hypothetical protein AB0758_48650 [Tolypothrix bouteillei VB521301_2]|uniref:hypothetical protein n=1 Tax=Tolypothrix bouteillei TaxID=1246981 RepID=UPI0038B4CF1D